MPKPLLLTVSMIFETNENNITLRKAIEQANSIAGIAENVTIDMSGLSGTITLTGDLPAISGNAVIYGSNSANLTINGVSTYRVFSGTKRECIH